MHGSTNRDQVVEHLLRQAAPALTAAPAAGDAACLDAEAVAAWMDGALTDDALRTAEAHVATCARCQAIVGTFARIEVVPPAAAATVDAAPAWRGWITWLASAAAVAVALVLWVSRSPEPASRPQAPASVSARAEPPASQASPVDAPSAPAAPPPTPRERTEDAAAARAPSAASPVARNTTEDRAAKTVSGPTAAVAAPPAAAEPQLQAAQRFDAADARREQAAAPAAAASIAVAPLPAIDSPDPNVRWRLGGSRVERTTDNGTTWQTVFQEEGVLLTAGSAPSPAVCWIVGRSGVVLRSTEGAAFTRVPFPNTQPLAAVTAADAESATVTTAAGETFVTTDGGGTWR